MRTWITGSYPRRHNPEMQSRAGNTTSSSNPWSYERMRRAALIVGIVGITLLYGLGIAGLVLKHQILKNVDLTPTVAATPLPTATQFVAPVRITSIPITEPSVGPLEATPTQQVLVFPTAVPTDTFTPTPQTQTPTETAAQPPTLSSTSEPTASHTPEPPSATPTPRATDTPRAEPTATPTPTGTAVTLPEQPDLTPPSIEPTVTVAGSAATTQFNR